MDLPRLSRTVRRITVLNRDDAGNDVPVVVFEKGSRRKKNGARALKSVERLARRLAEASSVSTSQYLRAHRKSNRKWRHGWLRDMNVNAVQAGRKGLRKLDPGRLLSL